ncbi:uncharacterized protein MICPUCDRAFT_57416 [Micromonas pusilla CCMP1545]|uniref:Predicted protein n=1 Tax=Micromonas pusilla (strain CCMP1545) TaxID=564608 RepID=C1MQU5_MICPC|nr:uncharacterized protein MICPUCDRAFT_57416 [Micromonas pusilla CCMP1545]EEH57768.1 predicted protein [Micromonas pusilla CCMP1545]|eukprot:XP_003057817.1 predicted protein [Micromonas pusilla CCMP1545]
MTADAEKKVITINVKLLPKYHSDHAQLTRYQLGHRKDYVGKLTRVKCSPSDTIKELKAQIEKERGSPVQYVKRGGTPTGVILSDDATLESLGLDYDMSVYEHLWEDSDENQEKFVVDREKVREMVGMFMMEHPDIGRHGPEVTGEAEDPKDWTAKNLKKRENMEKEVQKERERKQKRREEEAAKATAAAKAAKEGKPVAA